MDQKLSDKPADWEGTIRRLQAMAVNRADQEIAHLRRRISVETDKTHQMIVERVAREANVDLTQIYEDARRRNAARSRYVTQAIEKISVGTLKETTELRQARERSRELYLKRFGEVIKLRDLDLVRFQDATDVNGVAYPARCHVVMGYGCSAPDPGTYEATAAARLVDGALMFHPFIHTSSGDCEDSGWASVLQNANFTRAAPDRLFHVQRVLVEMSGTGHGYAHLGGYGFWQNPNPAYDHTTVKLSLYLEQYVPGNEFGGAWPINDRPVLLRNGDYNQAITIEAEQAEFDYYLQGKQDGGGDLFCFLRLDTRATALGSDARVHIDFSEESGFYIRVNGILLIGKYV